MKVVACSLRLNRDETNPDVVICDAKPTHHDIEIVSINRDCIEFLVHVKGNLVSAKKHEFIQVSTNSEFRPVMPIPVTWAVAKEIEINPVVLSVKAGEVTVKTLAIETLKRSRLIDVQLPAACKLEIPIDLEKLMHNHQLRLQLYSSANTNDSIRGESMSAIGLRLRDEFGEIVSLDVPIYFFQ